MKKIFLTFVFCSLCIACGVKEDPEYKSQNNNYKVIFLV